MRREIKADGFQLLAKFFHRPPLRHVRKRDPRRILTAEETHLLRCAVASFALSVTQKPFKTGHELCAVGVQRIQCARPDQVLQKPLVDYRAVKTPDKIGK